MKKKRTLSVQERIILSVSEAAAMLGDSERAVWSNIYRGKIPHRRWGRRVVILKDELEQYLKALPGPTLADSLAKAEAAAR